MKRPNFGIVLILIAVLISLFAGYVARHLGLLKGVDLSEIDSPGFTMLVQEHLGPYHQIVPTLNEIEAWAKEHHVPCAKTVAEFLDDPHKTDEARLRSRVGCWVSEGAFAARVELPANFSFETVPAGRMLRARFAGSPAIGPWKVYPQVKGYFADHQKTYVMPNFEIYTVSPDNTVKTEYLFWLR